MIDDVLRADAQRWNAAQPPAPDLDEAINRLDRDSRAPRSRRMFLSGLAAASVVAAAAAAVVISASVGQGGHGATTAGSPRPLDRETQTVVREVTVTHTANVTHIVVATEPGRATANRTVTSDLLLTVTATHGAESSAEATTAITVADPVRPVDLAATKARPVVGHARALLASIGLFVAIAGAWGIGRAQRRRAH